MMDLQAYLCTDNQVRHAQEHLQRVGDPSIGRIFHRHHAEFDVASIHFLKDGCDIVDAEKLDRLAKALDGGQMAITVFGAKISDFQYLLKCPRAAHDLAENGADGARVERPFIFLVELQDVLQHFFFAGR